VNPTGAAFRPTEHVAACHATRGLIVADMTTPLTEDARHEAPVEPPQHESHPARARQVTQPEITHPRARAPKALSGSELFRQRSWTRRYARLLWFSDAAVIIITLSGSAEALGARGTDSVEVQGFGATSYGWGMAVIGLIWLVALNIIDSRSDHIVGHGNTEYGRVINGTVAGFLTALAIAFFLRIDLARSLFLVSAPIGVVLLLGSRWLWRQWLRRRQSQGEYLHRAVIVGDPAKVAHIAAMIRDTGDTGFEIVGAITKRAESVRFADGLKVISGYADAVAAIDEVGADTLIVASADDLGPKTLRVLGWAMAERDVQWIVAPAMTDIAGPRIHARPVAGLPLVHVAFPTLEGWRGFLKRGMDTAVAGALILLLAPVFIVVAIVVKAGSAGPVFYRQERIGRGGIPFGMIKFRSMTHNADDQLAALLDLQGTSDKPLFKVVDDPRVTPAGRFMRKYSIDELPQLLNVLAGEMSLVGPRPQRPAEVALYDDTAHRRLRVKPGMSGLWQVSGRSALSWEDAIRLDLYYVENWSLAQDFIILLRTFSAVLRPGSTAH